MRLLGGPPSGTSSPIDIFSSIFLWFFFPPSLLIVTQGTQPPSLFPLFSSPYPGDDIVIFVKFRWIFARWRNIRSRCRVSWSISSPSDCGSPFLLLFFQGPGPKCLPVLFVNFILFILFSPRLDPLASWPACEHRSIWACFFCLLFFFLEKATLPPWFGFGLLLAWFFLVERGPRTGNGSAFSVAVGGLRVYWQMGMAVFFWGHFRTVQIRNPFRNPPQPPFSFAFPLRDRSPLFLKKALRRGSFPWGSFQFPSRHLDFLSRNRPF